MRCDVNILFNPKDGSTLFSLENGDGWLLKFGIQMVMTDAHTHDGMVVPEITKEFLDGLEREDLPKIKFDALLLPFAIALIGEVMSEMEEQEIDVVPLSGMLFVMDDWLVGKDCLGTTTIQ